MSDIVDNQNKLIDQSKNKIKEISNFLQNKIYLLIGAVPVADTIIQSFEESGFNTFRSATLIALCASIGYINKKNINKIIKQSKSELEDCINNSEQNTENLELLLENIPGIGFFMIDENNEYTKVNKEFAKMIGKEIKEITGKNDQELFPLLPEKLRSELLEANKQSLDNMGENDNTLESIISLPIIDGDERILMIKKIPFVTAGKKRMMGACIDISGFIEKQKVLELENETTKILAKKTEEVANLKSAFFANMSHELRTPLNAIIGFSSLGKNKFETEKMQEFFSIINNQGEKLLQIVNEILTLSKCDVGMMKANYKKACINLIIEDIVLAQNGSISKANPNINIRINSNIEKIPNLVLADEDKITQILNNLIGNAVKFTENGHIEVSCPKIEENEEESNIYISVKDSGIGIPEDKQNDIFERFVQIEKFSIGKGGTGLGLPLVKELTKILGGEITLESELGVGSNFTFSFIVKKNEENKNNDQKIMENKVKSIVN